MLVVWIVIEITYVHDLPVMDYVTIYDNEEEAQRHKVRTKADRAEVHRRRVLSKHKENK